MPPGKTAERSGGKKRRWRSPPPLTRDPGSPGPEGLSIIGEIPSPTGALLWKTFRAFLLWGSVEPEEREGLFHTSTPGRREAEIRRVFRRDRSELRPLIESTVEVLSEPQDAEPEIVAAMARQIARWAREAGAGRTELEFLRAGALADPSNPRIALAAGKVAAENLQLAAAEAWMMRAIALARRRKDATTYMQAYLDHGAMLIRRGSLPAARASFLKAVRRAIRQGNRELRARALHQLFMVDEITGETSSAYEHAAEAAGLLDPGDRSLHQLVREVALLLLRERHYAQAVRLFSVLAEVATRIELPLVLGPMARAAAGAGDEKAFHRAWSRMDRLDAGPGTPAAWLEVGRASLELGRTERATEAVEYARRMAAFRPGSQVDFLARILSENIRAGSMSSPARPRRASPQVRELVDRLTGLVEEHG